MPFIGNKPSAIPLTSADIADSIITSAKIVDGTIVNADINASAAIAGTKLTGAGKVLQVVTATDSTDRTTTSATFVTGSNTLSVTITPSSASNKIFVICSSTVHVNNSSLARYFTIFRGATNLGGSNGMSALYAENGAHPVTPLILSCLDSPNTTSATTYQVYMRTESSSTGFLTWNNTTSSITAFEIAG
jgi:hypothetical protein